MKYWFGLLISLLSISVQATTLDELQKKLQAPSVVRAQFVQTRTISGMKKPLVSSGKVIIAKEKGIWWSQELPFQLTMLFTDDRMIQKMAGQDPVVITEDKQPQLFQFNYLMRALVQADEQVLRKNFKLSIKDINGKYWQLGLIPTTLPLNKIFSEIQLTGDAYINQIVLFDKQGDKTEIRFMQQTSQPGALTDEEKQNFSGQ